MFKMNKLEEIFFHTKPEEIFDASRGLISYAFRNKLGELYFAHLIDKAERFIEFLIFPIQEDDIFKLRFGDVSWKELIPTNDNVFKYYLSYSSRSKAPSTVAVSQVEKEQIQFLVNYQPTV